MTPPNASGDWRRAVTTQLEPVPDPNPEERPWVAAGEAAWDARGVYEA